MRGRMHQACNDAAQALDLRVCSDRWNGGITLNARMLFPECSPESYWDIRPQPSHSRPHYHYNMPVMVGSLEFAKGCVKAARDFCAVTICKMVTNLRQGRGPFVATFVTEVADIFLGYPNAYPICVACQRRRSMTRALLDWIGQDKTRQDLAGPRPIEERIGVAGAGDQARAAGAARVFIDESNEPLLLSSSRRSDANAATCHNMRTPRAARVLCSHRSHSRCAVGMPHD
ncbi:hypothetical protein [Bradyrhizobium embrapense]|uniref:hypothetical protein n=1 Tax=Bradyrhizobium embrapense TaxID=630921 RepID=UPI001560BB50|nr:hypothetical protein [Bradyrhizobium embrapense]